MIQKKSVASLGIINVGSAVLGLAFSVVLAQCYGVSKDVEIYFSASSLLFLISSLTQTGQLSEITLPIYHRLIESYGKQQAQRIFSVVLNLVGAIGIAVAILSYIFSDFLVSSFVPGFSDNEKQITLQYFQIITPLLFLEILKGQLITLLNAEKIYGKVELTGVINQVIAIAFILLFHEKLGAFAAMVGLVTGEILSFVICIYFIFKLRYAYAFTFADPRLPLQSILKMMGSIYVYVLCTQGYAFVFNAGLSKLAPGMLAIYRYSVLIFTKTQSLVNRPVATVFFTQFSSAFASEKHKLKSLIRQTNNLTLLAGFVLLLIVFASGEYAMRFLWLNEKFNAFEIRITFFALFLMFNLVFVNGIALVYRKIAATITLSSPVFLINAGIQIFCGALSWLLLPDYGFFASVFILMLNNTLLGIVPLWIVIKSKEGIGFYLDKTFTIQLVAAICFGILLFSGLHFWLPPIKERINNLILGISFGLIALLWVYFSGKVFKWQEFADLEKKLLALVKKYV